MYPRQCDEEIKNNLIFPLGEVGKAIVCKGLFSFDHIIINANINSVIEIINDTSSYVWGEVGTFIHEKKIVFYGKKNDPIGITEIDADGVCTYFLPLFETDEMGFINNGGLPKTTKTYRR